MLSPTTYWMLLLAIAIYAFGRGSRDERIVVVMIFAASVATGLVYAPGSGSYDEMELGVLLVDLAALTGFIIVALLSTRFWPLWVAGFQLTSVLSHAMKVVHWDLIPQVYAAAERFWIYPIFLALIVGTWRAHRHMPIDRSTAHPA